MKIEINQCPYCKSKSGFQVSTPCRGEYVMDFLFNGEEESGQYTEGMSYGKRKTPVCSDCLKPLGRWIKF